MNEYQYGYYQYKDIKTSSKYEIMRLCDDPTQVTWHYHDEYFSSFNWSKQPSDSIDTLYRKRCEQLRSSYDYIVLMYSARVSVRVTASLLLVHIVIFQFRSRDSSCCHNMLHAYVPSLCLSMRYNLILHNLHMLIKKRMTRERKKRYMAYVVYALVIMWFSVNYTAMSSQTKPFPLL